jgi:hypothetical protein
MRRLKPHWWATVGAIYTEWQLFKRTDTALGVLSATRLGLAAHSVVDRCVRLGVGAGVRIRVGLSVIW